MIPLTADKLIPKKIGRVTYHCRPPLGDIEISVANLMSGEDLPLRAMYDKAKKEIDRSLKGKKQPKKEQYDKLVENKALEIYQAEAGKDVAKEVQKVNKFFDLVVANWSTDDPEVELPDFPERPSQNVTIGNKKALCEWYETLLVVDEDESKN